MWQCIAGRAGVPARNLSPPARSSPSHVFSLSRPDWIDNWSGLERPEYERKKEEVADAIVARLEKVFPGLKAATLFRWGLVG